MKSLGMNPNKETFHYLMMAYASSGDTKGCAKIYQKYLNDEFEITTIVMNINLASIVYGDEFNWEIFSMLYKKYFDSKELAPNRFTYSQYLLACGKAGKTDLAIKCFEEVLDSNNIKLTEELKNIFKQSIGIDKYNEWKSTLDSKDQFLLYNAIDTTIKKNPGKETEIITPIMTNYQPAQIPRRKYVPSVKKDIPPIPPPQIKKYVFKKTTMTSEVQTKLPRKIFDFHNKNVKYVPPDFDFKSKKV